MTRNRQRIVTILLLLFVGCAAAQTPEQIGTVRQIYDGTLFPDVQVRTFRNIDRLFPVRVVKHGANTYPLPKSDTPLKGVEFTSAGKKYDLYDYMSLTRIIHERGSSADFAGVSAV